MYLILRLSVYPGSITPIVLLRLFVTYRFPLTGLRSVFKETLRAQIIEEQSKIVVKLIQDQVNLDIKISTSTKEGKKNIILKNYLIFDKEVDKIIYFSENEYVEWISIDPNYKLLREIEYSNVSSENAFVPTY